MKKILANAQVNRLLQRPFKGFATVTQFLPLIACLLLIDIGALAQRPNIVLILADDLGYGDIGAFGNQIIKTPHLDQMAKEGMKLSQFYAGSTVCTPSRNALMTGQHGGHVYLRGNSEHALRQQDTTIAEKLRAAGYQTALFGKWGIGDINTEGEPYKKGWNTFYGLLHNVEAHFQFPNIAWKSNPNKPQLQRVLAQGKEGFGCNFFMDRAIEWLDQQNGKDPFFAFISLPIPHAELMPPASALANYTQENGGSVFQEKPFVGSHYGSQAMPKAAYAALVTQLDAYVGRVLEHLKAKGWDKNTLVLFSSDNGTHIEGGRSKEDVAFMQSSGPLKGNKRDLFEGGIRVPTLIWGKGIAAGKVNHSIGAFWDVFPTFLELAQVKTSKNGDGISLWPFWKNQQMAPERPMYWEFHEGGFSQALRWGKWKYIKRVNAQGSTEEHLFNLEEDLAENHNLAASEVQSLERMRAQANSMHQKAELEQYHLKTEKGK